MTLLVLNNRAYSVKGKIYLLFLFPNVIILSISSALLTTKADRSLTYTPMSGLSFTYKKIVNYMYNHSL